MTHSLNGDLCVEPSLDPPDDPPEVHCDTCDDLGEACEACARGNLWRCVDCCDEHRPGARVWSPDPEKSTDRQGHAHARLPGAGR